MANLRYLDTLAILLFLRKGYIGGICVYVYSIEACWGLLDLEIDVDSLARSH